MQLNEVCSAIVDCEHKTAPIVADGYPSIRTPNIGPGYFILDGVNRVNRETYEAWTKRLRPLPGDLIMAREAPVGNVAMIPEGLEPCLGQRTLLIRPDPAVVDSRYLVYLLISPVVQQQIHGKTNGATVAHLNMADVRKLALPELPVLAIQRRIASILSAYDDQIENNRKRIAILEDMARRLYREWFVHFRYPGHESVPLVDSPLGRIPQGWMSMTLAAVCSGDGGIQTGPFGSQLHESDYSPSGVPVVMPRILIGFRIDASNADHIPEETAQRLSRHRMLPGDIVYGRRGDIGRRAFISRKYAGWFCGTGCLRIRPNPGVISPFYLFNHLGQDEVLGNIRGRAQGVTLPNLSAGVMESVPITIPPRQIQESFESAAIPMQELAENLHDQIHVLRRTRDLILPRLMSGTLAVEALATAEAMP